MTIAAAEFSNTGLYRAVYFDGPQPEQNKDGDEIPVWVVYVGDAEAEPTGTVYTCHDFAAAERLARQMAADRRLDFVHDASPA
jgi:hypothetical protein